jgi:hypothetical protein
MVGRRGGREGGKEEGMEGELEREEERWVSEEGRSKRREGRG